MNATFLGQRPDFCITSPQQLLAIAPNKCRALKLCIAVSWIVLLPLVLRLIIPLPAALLWPQYLTAFALSVSSCRLFNAKCSC